MSKEVEFPALSGSQDRQTNQPTNMRGHGPEVTLHHYASLFIIFLLSTMMIKYFIRIKTINRSYFYICINLYSLLLPTNYVHTNLHKLVLRGAKRARREKC